MKLCVCDRMVVTAWSHCSQTLGNNNDITIFHSWSQTNVVVVVKFMFFSHQNLGIHTTCWQVSASSSFFLLFWPNFLAAQTNELLCDVWRRGSFVVTRRAFKQLRNNEIQPPTGTPLGVKAHQSFVDSGIPSSKYKPCTESNQRENLLRLSTHWYTQNISEYTKLKRHNKSVLEHLLWPGELQTEAIETLLRCVSASGSTIVC